MQCSRQRHARAILWTLSIGSSAMKITTSLHQRAIAAAAGLALVLFAQAARADGVPVISPTEIAQLTKQLDTLKQALAQAQDQYKAVTGAYQRGAAYVQDTINSVKAIPGSWQEMVQQQKDGVYAQLQSKYEQVMQTIDPKTFTDQLRGSSYKLNTDTTRSALAGSDALFSEAQTHIDNFTSLLKQVDTTVNVKDAADLQNRMSAEIGLAQAAQVKMTGLVAQVLAAQANRDNQAEATRAKFFGRATTGGTQ
ncbi:TrbJ/VirB5 family protein [Burkholderia cenocepacia]|uniref:type IV secretion system protein n=2 Tax=Burkholderia cenocepacia TaxID=95486 RepID=UPI003873B951